ncbi:hypothetical protein Ddye_030774 [Dipteronia dyeriana]|uniref:O-fucosyltransferase family protein n=1 Tax=Dipteronia dyeriana TaxID=168575 RepID=A0AAD9THN8_9ROSI|nr:hypothetical protein Ddye_030774 [Dipteronia dyeriana]
MGYYSKLVSIEETEYNHEDEEEEEEKPYSKIKMRYINTIKAKKSKNILVARIRMAQIQLWLVRVTSMVMLWAIALQLRALGNTIAPTPNFPSLPPPRFYHSNGYLLVSSNGGLNQMRSGICDMVTIARFLNVTLIVPQLDNTSFWNDYSQFSDTYDVDYFINSLKDEVRILKDLPLALKRKVEAENLYSMPPIIWSNMTYYYDVVKKEALLPPEDLRPFQNHANQMAALDYHVAVHSDIFIPTNGENMAKVVEGHPRKVVVELIDAYKYGKINWDEFVRSVKKTHGDRWGGPTKRLQVAGTPKEEDYFYTNPQNACHNTINHDRVAPHFFATKWK